MGFRALNMTHSEKLAAIIAETEGKGGDDITLLGDACDMVSTPGYDNDGSIGPELLDNGVGLGMSARDYDPQAIVFFAFGEDQCYYQYGADEDDAVRRLREALAED